MKIVGTYPHATLPTALTSATYNALNQLTAWGTTAFTYDANGNMLTEGSKTFTWDSRNRLTALSSPASTSFKYDALTRRTKRTIGGTATDFLYDGVNPVQELNGVTPTANFLTGLRYDEYFRRTDSAGARDFVTDALGSTITLTDSTGATQTQYTYEPFGKLISSGQSSGNSYTYTGRENDSATNLMFYRARYYSPTYQRFISQDPIGFAGGDVNLYAYVGNKPVNFIDPYGLWSISGAWADGFGFTVTLGHDDGGWFIEGMAGMGYGEGWSFNPGGKFSAPCGTLAYAGVGLSLSGTLATGLPVGVTGSYNVIGAFGVGGEDASSSGLSFDGFSIGPGGGASYIVGGAVGIRF